MIESVMNWLATAGALGPVALLWVSLQATYTALMALGTFGLVVRSNKAVSASVVFEQAKKDKRYAKVAAYGLMTYAGNNWLAIDRAAYVKWLAGDPNGTISGGIGKAILSGHNNWFLQCVDDVLSYFDPRARGPLTQLELDHIDAIGLELTVPNVQLYTSSHCIRNINPYAGRGSTTDRRVWQ